MPDAIEIRGLQKVIDQNLAVDIAALTVQAGEIAAIVGPPGSGKATLLQLLTGRIRPTAGTLCVLGLSPSAEKEKLSRALGVLFADDAVYKRQSPYSNLRFHCRLYGLPKSRADEVLTLVGLADRAKAKLDKLPSGLVRRLAFGCAMVHQPKVILLVEPFARCDEGSISLLSSLARQLADDGAALLILADDSANLTSLCDTIHHFSRGSIVESYNPQQEQQIEFPFKIPVRLEASVALLNPGDILYVTTEQSRTYLHTVEGQLPAQFTLTELEQRLARSGFFRAHRGYLVNLQHVKEVIPYTRNSFSLILDDAGETEIPLSKSAARELRELLDY
ncbi:MAG: LytTR family transcriptional regulator DNA-binding domain-containing protein [Anaerolineae bacterium]|jgi:ABC-2 type transport system ATP-binding protein